MNLSDHSRSIHTQLLTLQRLTSHLQEETGLGLSGWLKGLGLGPWLREIIYSALIVLAVILILLAILPCIMNCIQQMITKLLSQAFQANLASLKENRGNVESFVDAWLADKGHDQLQLLRQYISSKRTVSFQLGNWSKVMISQNTEAGCENRFWLAQLNRKTFIG